jgi:hypothetical protein
VTLASFNGQEILTALRSSLIFASITAGVVVLLATILTACENIRLPVRDRLSGRR